MRSTFPKDYSKGLITLTSTPSSLQRLDAARAVARLCDKADTILGSLWSLVCTMPSAS